MGGPSRLVHAGPPACAQLLAAVSRGLEASAPLPRCADGLAGPLVRAVVGAEAAARLQSHPLVPLIRDAVALRTRALDRWVETWGLELAAANFIPPTMRRQLVIVGGAWDTRVYRLGLHRATTVFEVLDSSSLLDAKSEAMQRLGAVPRCAVRRIIADPASPGAMVAALSRAGFDTRIPTRWLLDDCLPYLPPNHIPSLLSEARALGSAPGSGLGALALAPEWHARLAAAGLSMGAPSIDADDDPNIGTVGLAAASADRTDPAALSIDTVGPSIDAAGARASLLSPEEAMAAVRAAGWRRPRVLGPATLRSASLRERWVDGLPPSAGIAPAPVFPDQTTRGSELWPARDGAAGAVGGGGGGGGGGTGRGEVGEETLEGVCLVLADAEMYP
eukprot:scaffold12161_cov123-Isochrysis_galbana.AAC.2